MGEKKGEEKKETSLKMREKRPPQWASTLQPTGYRLKEELHVPYIHHKSRF